MLCQSATAAYSCAWLRHFTFLQHSNQCWVSCLWEWSLPWQTEILSISRYKIHVKTCLEHVEYVKFWVKCFQLQPELSKCITDLQGSSWVAIGLSNSKWISLKKIWWTHILLWVQWYPYFGLLMMSLWVSKPEWATSFTLGRGTHDVHSLRFISGATLADLLIAWQSVPHMHVSVEVGC